MDLKKTLEDHRKWLADDGGRRADLRGADLRGAKGILTAGPCNGWMMYAVRWDDGPRIAAGCRWFTVDEARKHWDENHSGGPDHTSRMRAGVDALVTLAKAEGWNV